MEHHGIPALPSRSIEDFIERRTHLGPFDLYRASSRRYPEHLLADDQHQCLAGACPHLYTPVEAEKKFMKERREMMNNTAVYVLTRYDVYTLSLLLSRQGRMEQGSILRRLAKGEEENGVLERFRYDGAALRLQDDH